MGHRKDNLIFTTRSGRIGATAGTIAGFAEDVKRKNFGSDFNGLRGDPHAVCEVADWQSLRSGKQPSV
jgi:hypothetical protein